MAVKNHSYSVWGRVVQNWLAAALLMAGVASGGAFLTALAGGFGGWVAVSAVVTVALLTAGVLAARAGQRRRTAESSTIVYRPDSPDIAVDVDTTTGIRTPRVE